MRAEHSLPYFAPRRPRVLAHRGLAVDAPENTLLAFAHALALGVDHLETDVHVSRDGVAMIAHDPDLDRVAGHGAKVHELRAAELAGIDLGAGQSMPTLAEALEAFPDARFNIDLKVAGAVAPTVDVIRSARAQDRVLLTSFSESRRRAALQLLPGVATSASGPRFVAALLSAAIGARPLLRSALQGLHAVQIPERALGLRTTTPSRIRAFQSVGVEVHVWTINEISDMERLLDAGVDGIVTDRADRAVEIIARRVS